MPPRLALFDFDGTLADSFPFFVSVLNGMADRHGFRRVEPDEVPGLRRLGTRELLRHFHLPLWKVPFLARDMKRQMAARIGEIALFPGMAEVLRKLHSSGVRLAVVTSNSEPNVRSVLGPELSALIELYGCNTGLLGKAAQFRKVLRRARVEPSDALCLGDELRDHEAAVAVGIPFGAVSWGYAAPEVLQARAPSFMFASVEQIARVVAHVPASAAGS